VVELTFRLGGVTFATPGEYRFQLYADDEFLIERRLIAMPASGTWPMNPRNEIAIATPAASRVVGPPVPLVAPDRNYATVALASVGQEQIQLFVSDRPSPRPNRNRPIEPPKPASWLPRGRKPEPTPIWPQFHQVSILSDG
jgi:hypothetical protein